MSRAETSVGMGRKEPGRTEVEDVNAQETVDRSGEAVSLRFGEFEQRLDSLELLRGGERVPLQQQPARLLALLARRSGVTVSREEIRESIWGGETFVDSEQGINYCIRQIRIALDDRAEEPRFVETVPKRGYRFVHPVEVVSATPEADRLGGRRSPRRRRLLRRAAVAAGVVVVGAALALVAVRSAPDSDPREPVRTLVIPEEAHFRYLEARHLLDRTDGADPIGDATRAIELLRATLEEAPDYAPAHAALGDAWLYRYDLPRAEALRRAERSARRALELDPDLAPAHALLAAPLLFVHFDWEGATEHVARALDLQPDNVDALFMKAILLSARGRHDEGIAAARHALELDPGHLPNVSLGWFYFFARRYDRAIEEAERILEIAPTDEPSHRVLLLAALEKGDDERARRELERFWVAKIEEDYVRSGIEPPSDEEIRARMADTPPVREIFRSWHQSFDEERHLEEQAMNPTIPAEYAVYAGEPATAVDHLLWGCREQVGSWDLPFVAEDPRWDPLRAEPRFTEVLRCVGVQEAGIRIPGLHRLFD